jgi:hypothetical protein
MKSTWGRPSVVGRPPPRESRPKDTSLGRGRGRCWELVSSLGGSRGEASGEGEGDEAPSGCEDDMVGVAVRNVRCMALARATWTNLVAYRCKGHTCLDWQLFGGSH